jgi:Zn-dependent protease
LPDTTKFCPSCGFPLASGELKCSKCGHLAHAPELEQIAQQARVRETTGDRAGAAELWRQALDLLPPESQEASVNRGRVARLAGPLPPESQKPQPAWVKRLGPFGVAAAALLKFKTVALLFLTKAKFLLLGLGKLQTLLSMLATIGVYWSLYGWKFAAGFVIGIYIHEMGHVWMLRHYGLRASAPMFIPGFGAFVSLYDSPPDVGVDARIGLAGPLWGAGAAVVSLLPALTSNDGVWLAIAHATAYINLFNLTPVWTLDGGRAFRALDYKQRLFWLGLVAALWFATGQGMFVILILGGLYRVFWKKDHAPVPDQGAFFQFAGLLLLFGALLGYVAVRQ